MIFDVSWLDNPTLGGSYVHETEIDQQQLRQERRRLPVQLPGWLRILDVRKVADGKLSTAGFFDVYLDDDAAEFTRDVEQLSVLQVR